MGKYILPILFSFSSNKIMLVEKYIKKYGTLK